MVHIFTYKLISFNWLLDSVILSFKLSQKKEKEKKKKEVVPLFRKPAAFGG